MIASDVMVRDVKTVRPAPASPKPHRSLRRTICALPVVDDDEHLVGIISEADLLRREEIGADVRRPPMGLRPLPRLRRLRRNSRNLTASR